jgi:hypothetical protein
MMKNKRLSLNIIYVPTKLNNLHLLTLHNAQNVTMQPVPLIHTEQEDNENTNSIYWQVCFSSFSRAD